jgi:hypothetical protein
MMFTRLAVLIFLIGFSSLAYSQNTVIEDNDQVKNVDRLSREISSYLAQKRRDISIDSSEDRYFSTAAYDRFFDKYFTLLNYERSNFTEGNSAALDIKENESRLNLTLSHKVKSSIFSVGTAVNITDNSGVLFSGSGPSAGTQFSVNHSFLLRNFRLLEYFEENREQNYIERKHILDSLELLYKLKNPGQIRQLLQKKADLEKKKNDLENQLSTAPEARKDSLRELLVNTVDDILKNREDLRSFSQLLVYDDFVAALQKVTDDLSTERELLNKGVTSFRLRWISYGITYRRDNYATWDSTLSMAERVDEQGFNKWSLSAAYNFVYQRTKEYMAFNKRRTLNSLYLSGVYSLIRNNNFSGISDQDYFLRKQTIQADTLYELSSNKKLKDISGKKFEEHFDHQFALQGTALFGQKGFFGFNLRQELVVGKNLPVYNSRIGTLFRFIDSKDEKSKVNFELFLLLSDLADNKASNKSTWQRKVIGIAATVPFTKVFFQ